MTFPHTYTSELPSSAATLENLQKRIDWIDALKGFGIFCVTFGHCNPWSPLEKYIYSFHMFLFFFISGFLFTIKEDRKKMLINCFKKLLLPFIAWNTVSSLNDSLPKKDFGLFIREFFVLGGKLTSNPPIWFLLVLFITELIFILLKLHRHTLISVAAMTLSLTLWIIFGHEWVLWKLNLVPMALSFFLLGYIFKPFVYKIGKKCILIPLGIISIFFALQNIRIVYTYGKFGNYLYCIIAAFCGTLLMVGLFSSAKVFTRLNFLIEWGKNSLMIMATQYFVFDAITLLSQHFFEMNLMKYKDTFISFSVALFTVFFINSMVSVIKKLTYKSKFLRAVGVTFGIQYHMPLPVLSAPTPDDK